MISLPNSADTFLSGKMPHNGNSTSGSKAVTVIGTTSPIHHIDIQAVTPRAKRAEGAILSKTGTVASRRKLSGPAARARVERRI